LSSGGAEAEIERQARRVFYRAGNHQINKFVRAVGLSGRR